MIYVILGAVAVVAGLFIWAKIERAGKLKAIRARDLAIGNAIALEKKFTDIKNNVDQVLDYNTKDEKAKKEINQSIATLKSAKKEEEVKVEYEKIRSRVYDAIIDL